MKKFHTFKPQSFELLTGLRSFLAVTLMIVMALGNVKAGEITHVFTETSGSINEQISFTTAKNSSQTAPAVYSSQLRVYYAPNGNGGSCTLEIADGYVITGLTIFARSSYTPTCNYSVDGGGNETATLLGTQYTISDIYATESLTFQNGNTVNMQLRVDSIKITYKQICYTPTGLQVSNVGSTDASLRWIKGGTETNWQMNLNGNVSDLTGAFVDNDTVTYNLSGLNIHAPYQVAVNAACAPDNLSSWSDTVDFTTICPVYSTTLSDVSICEGDVFPFHGQNITVTGDYEALLTSSTDCDSTLYLHVEVIPIPVYTLPIQTICEGESYLFGGEELTTAGTYRDTISTLHCDSIVILTLEVLPYALLNVTEYICEGESFTFDGVDLTVGGNYTQTLTGGAANGCDSVTNLTLIVKPVPVENIDVSICEGSGYDFNGDILTTAGDYHDTLVAANGCDSIVNLTLTVNPVYSHVDEQTICSNELPYTYVDTTFEVGTISDVYDIYFTSVHGCDSLVVLTLNVKPVPDTVILDEAICQDGTYDFYGMPQTTAGVYHHTLMAANGCDSVVELRLTVNPTYAGTDTIHVCDNSYPINYEGNTFIDAGDKTINLTSVLGCDSVITLTIIEHPTYALEEDIIICASELPYNYHNLINFETAGIYTMPFNTVDGCDSIVNVNLIVNPVYNFNDTVVVCSGDLPQVYHGRTFDEASISGDYRFTFESVDGCDSIIDLNLTINPSYEFTHEPIVVCDNHLPVIIGDSAFNASGDYEVHFTLPTGCDSLVNVNITVNPTYHTYDAVSICELPYIYKNQHTFGLDTTVTGNYDVLFATENGCDSIVTLALTVNHNYHTFDTVTICNNILPLFTYNDGSSFDAAGDYEIHFTSATNCDSLVSLHLIVNPTYQHTDEVTICEDMLPYHYGGSIFTAAGVYDVHFTLPTSCDSLVTLTLNVNSIYHHTDEVTVCDVDLPYSYGDSTFTAAGTYDVHFSTTNSCDSVVTLTLNVNPNYVGVDTTRICVTELPYEYPNNSSYPHENYIFPEGTVTGTYPIHLTSVAGCDSLINLYLEVNPIYDHTDAVTICDSELPYNYNDIETFGVGTISGTVTFSLYSVSGCDSTVTLTLTVNPTYEVSVAGEICDGDTYTIHAGTEFERNLTVAGIYIDTLKTIHQCDSIVTLTLTVHELPNVQIVSVGNVCNGESIILTATGIDMYNASMEEDFTTMGGANNSEYGALARIPNGTLTNFPTVNYVYPAGGAIRLGSSTRTGSMTSVAMDLSQPFTLIMGVKGWEDNDGTILATVGTQTQTITAPQFATWANGGFTEIATSFNAATTNSTLTLATVSGHSAAYIDYIYVVPTASLRYSWNTGEVTSHISVSPVVETEYTVVGTDENGCVNSASTTITVNPTYNHTVDVAVCDNEVPYYHNGRLTGSVTGSYILNYLLMTGCDSTVTVNLTVNPTYDMNETVTICESELPYTYTDGATVFTAAGTQDILFSSVKGCDSLVHVTLIVNPTYSVNATEVICASELPYTYGDARNHTEFVAGTTSGTYPIHFTTVNGCDSLITLELTVNPIYSTADELTICASELPYTYGDAINQNVFLEDAVSGIYPIDFSTVNGCDSIVTLNLTINPTYDMYETVIICDSELPYTYTDGVTEFTAAGTQDILFTTVNGCDSLVHVTLIANPTYNVNVTEVICESELPYTFGDETNHHEFAVGTISGTYPIQFTTVNGCDSLVTVELTVNPSYNHADAVTICVNELPYTYGVAPYNTTFDEGTTTGNYQIHFTLPTGCDSIIDLALTVNDTNACSFVVDATADDNGTITPEGAQTVAHGSSVTFNITANTCYYINEILVDDVAIIITDPTTMSYTFDSVYVNHTIAATFANYQYNMTSTANGNGTVSADVVDCGANYDYVVTADHGYHIDSIYVDGALLQQFADENTDTYTHTLNNVTADHHVDAYFAINHYTVNTTTEGMGTVSVLGDSVVSFDESITYIISSQPCNNIVDVTVNGVSMIGEVADNMFTLSNIQEDAAVIFTFDTIEYVMGAIVDGNGFGTVSTGLGLCGQSYTYTITADEGSHISYIRLGSGVSTFSDESVTSELRIVFLVAHDTNIYVTFTLNKKHVTASVIGGNGTITPTDTIVDYGTTATLAVNADAANGYAIETITCGDSVLTFTDNTTSYNYDVVSVTSDTAVVATFALREYTIDVTAGLNGTITPDDTVITYGGDAHYTITADPCYAITSLTVDGVEVAITDPTTMTYDFTNVVDHHTLNAEFTILTYNMTSAASANGTVTPSETVDCGSDFTYNVEADAGYHIANVVIDGVTTTFLNNEVTFDTTFTNITANHNLEATFVINGYTVTATADANGTITPEGDSIVNYGDNVEYTVASNACYHLADLTVNGISVMADMVGNTYTLNNVVADVTVEATYAINTYQMSATYDNTLGTVSEATANCGDSYTYTIAANEGYHIESLTINGITTTYGNNSDVNATFTIDNVQTDTNLLVNFAINTYTVNTIITTGQGDVTPATATVNHGDDLTLTVTADAANGYHIMSITCGADVVNYGNNTDLTADYTITNITSDTVLSVAFGLDGHLITVINNGNGNVIPVDITLTHGDDATFTLTPDDCYYIGEVLVDGELATIDGDSTAATFTFDSVVVPHTIEVTFNIYQYAMTSDAYGHGTVNSAVVNCGSDFDYIVEAEEGYHIHTIFVDYVSDTLFQNQEATYTYSMTDIRANHNLIADFEINQYVVSAVAGANGTISPMVDSVVNHGDLITYTITPDPCYYVADLTVNGVSVLDQMVGNQFTLAAIAATTTVEATFAIYEYVMAANITGVGFVSDSIINCGTDYTYNIEAGVGYHIQTVEIGGVTTTYGTNDDVTATFTVTNASQDTTLNVVFAINGYQVTTAVAAGQGSFSPADTIINHGDDVTIDVIADVANGYHVQTIVCGSDTVLYGNNTDVNVPYTIYNVVSDTNISATFELNNYTITASNGANGTINPVGDSAVIYGDNVTYTITPDACYYISEILVDGVATVIADTTGTTYTFNAIDNNHSIEANFAIYQYNMTSIANGNGTVTDSVINCGDDYTYTIIADEGYHIIDVYADGVLDTTFANQEANYTYSFTNITAHHNVTVNFGINHYTITATAGANGTINPVGDSIATHGQDLVYTITPDHCYFIQDVLVDGVSVMTDLVGTVDGATYTFTAIDGPHTIDVAFEIYQYTMAAAITGNGTVSDSVINCGTNYTYQVQAGVGYHIETIQIGDSTATFGNNTDVTTTFDIINALQDTTLNVVFAINTYHVTTLVASGQGQFTPADTVVDHGQNVTFTIDADAANGYHIVDVTCGADVVAYGDNADITTTYTVYNIVSDTMVSANFALNTYNIVATEGANGHVAPIGTSVITHGDNFTYTITPDAPCYYISEILVDGAAIAIDDITGTTYTFNNVVDHHTISASFEIYQYNMTSNASGNGTVSSAVVNCGTDYTYNIAAAYGYHIDYVVVDGVIDTVFNNQEANYTYTFTNILTNHNVDAYFSINHYDIVSTTTANGTIAPLGTTTYTHGDNATYTITPNACYYISEILVDGAPIAIDDITGTTYTFTNIVAPHTIDVAFDIYQYNMTYTHNVGGIVTPVAVPTVVNCGTDYTYSVTANTGYHIESVTLDGVTTVYGNNNDIHVDVNVNGVSHDTHLDVVFAINTYTIDVTTIGNGTTTPSDTVVDYGTTITYNVNADHGYHITDVLVDGVSVGIFGNREDTAFVYTFTNVSDDHTLVAQFEISQYTITATAGANGTIMMPGVTTVNYNEDVLYTISANVGYHINTITIDGVLDTTFTHNENLYVYTFENVDADHTIDVDFTVNTYDVDVTAIGNGTITPGDTTLNYGDDITYIFTPNAGSEVVSVTVNGQDLGAFDSYTITDIAYDHTIEVVFGDITYHLEANAYGNGTITPADTTVGYLGTVVYTLTPDDDCYEISEILVNGVSYLANAAFNAIANTLTLNNIAEDMLVQAYYQVKTYTVTSSTTVGATITETGAYNCGSDVVYNITVDDCYNMDSVVVDGVVVANTTTITFNDIDANHTIDAYFSIKTFTVTSSVNDVAFGTITATNTFDCGETPTYTITPATGYHIVSVLVDGVDLGAIDSYTFTALDANHTIHAIFAINTYTITSTANTGVTIAPLEGDTIVDYGTNLTYTFTVDVCYTITDVIVDGNSVGAVNNYTFTAIDANHTISVLTTVNTYAIVATVNGIGGTITPAGTTNVDCQGSQNYTIAASNGYYIESVLVDGIDQGAIDSYNFSAVTADHTIEVTFAPYDSLQYTITSSAAINGTITPLGVTTVFHGGSQSYVITPDPMYEIDSVFVDNIFVGNVSYYNFANVTANHTIHATFTAGTCPAPTNPYESNITDSSATLNWGDVEANSYTIRYKKADDVTFTEIPGITTTNYVLTGLEEATTYVWSVKSVCIDSVAESNWTSQRTFVTLDAIDTTGIQDITIETINVYSYGNNIYVQNNTQQQIKEVQVFDMYGRMIYTGKAISNPEVISIQAAAGNYIVRVISDKQVSSYKVNIMQW